jgi:hypothetical protein
VCRQAERDAAARQAIPGWRRGPSLTRCRHRTHPSSRWR